MEGGAQVLQVAMDDGGGGGWVGEGGRGGCGKGRMRAVVGVVGRVVDGVDSKVLGSRDGGDRGSGRKVSR